MQQNNIGGKKQSTMKQDNILNSYSGITSLKDGTKLKVIVENYKQKLFPSGVDIMAGCKIEYVHRGMKSTRWVGNYFETHYTDEEMKKEVAHIIAEIAKNENNYKSQFAPL